MSKHLRRFPSVPLTALSADALKPKAQRYEISDGGCPALYLIVHPTGRKVWALRFHARGGRSAKLTLGPFIKLPQGKAPTATPQLDAPLTLADARAMAAEYIRQHKAGIDIAGIKRRKRLDRQAEDDKRFGPLAQAFVLQHAKRKTRRWVAQARLLGLLPAADGEEGLELIPRGLADRWRDRLVTEITDDDIYAVISEVAEHGVPGLRRRKKGRAEGMARAMYSTLNTLFDWLIEERKLRGLSPCTNVRAPKANDARKRDLNNEEIVKFWKATDEVSPPFSAALKLLLLTGCRRDEIADMRRTELSEDGLVLNIPGERTKNKLPHVVPLAPLAHEVLASVNGGGEYVFSTNGGISPIIGWARVKQRLDVLMGKIPPWVLHDLRRTAATGMAEIGIEPHIVEACLNHVSGHKAGVAGVYNKAKYTEQKKTALERWAAHIDRLVSGKAGAKVVPLSRKRSK